jgi:hypothetical protein
MPLVKTTISCEHEEFGRQEAASFQREVADIDAYDALWYCVRLLEIMGYDCSRLSMETSNGKIYHTDW